MTDKDWKRIEDAPSEKTRAVVFCQGTPEDGWMADMWLGEVGVEDPWNDRVTHWMRVPRPAEGETMKDKDWRVIEDVPSETTTAIVFCADVLEWQRTMWIDDVGGGRFIGTQKSPTGCPPQTRAKEKP